MMPQKRNPDPAELVRGRAAGGIGDLVGLLTLLKGLPLAYDRDLQEGKDLLFATVDRVESSLELMRHVVGALGFDRGRMEAAAGSGGLWATDLAEALVRRGVPFREAHAAVGSLVADLEEKELDLHATTVDVLNTHHGAFEDHDLELADPVRAVAARSQHGGTAPDRVREQANRLRGSLEELMLNLG
jgi:argininosuccinate lyase